MSFELRLPLFGHDKDSFTWQSAADGVREIMQVVDQKQLDIEELRAVNMVEANNPVTLDEWCLFKKVIEDGIKNQSERISQLNRTFGPFDDGSIEKNLYQAMLESNARKLDEWDKTVSLVERILIKTIGELKKTAHSYERKIMG